MAIGKIIIRGKAKPKIDDDNTTTLEEAKEKIRKGMQNDRPLDPNLHFIA